GTGAGARTARREHRGAGEPPGGCRDALVPPGPERRAGLASGARAGGALGRRERRGRRAAAPTTTSPPPLAALHLHLLLGGEARALERLLRQLLQLGARALLQEGREHVRVELGELAHRLLGEPAVLRGE